MLVILTENNNLYIVDDYIHAAQDEHDSTYLKNSNIEVKKVASNILEIYDDKNYKRELSVGDSEGAFYGIYALTSEGKLLSINAKLNGFVLGLSYEECTPYNVIEYTPMCYWQITKEGYLRDENNIQLNFILDQNNNKVNVKYWFSFWNGKEDENYFIMQDNKIYKLGYYKNDDVEIFNNYVELLNNKTVKNIDYDKNNLVFTVTYTDNTTDKYNVGVGTEGKKYGF